MTKKELKIVTVITLIVVAAFAGLIWFASTHKKPEPLPMQGNMVVDTDATDEEIRNKNPLSDRSVFFAGIEDATIDKEGVIALENLPENEDFMMKYVVYNADSNEQIYETDLIPSGKRINWRPGEKLSSGEYKLAFVEMPYAKDEASGEYQPLTQGRNTITLTIVD